MTPLHQSTLHSNGTPPFRRGEIAPQRRAEVAEAFKEQLRPFTPLSGSHRSDGCLVAERPAFTPREATKPTDRPNDLEVGLAGSSTAFAREAEGSESPASDGRGCGENQVKESSPLDFAAFGDSCWAEPLVRVLSCAAVGQAAAGRVQSPTAALDRILLHLVRRVGVGTDSVRLEFGDDFSNGSLLVHSTEDGLEIALQVHGGIDAQTLKDALTQRLSRKGIKVSRLEVT
jgi:hypothetical protein